MRKILTPLIIAFVLALLSSFAKPPVQNQQKVEMPAASIASVQ